MSLKECHNGLKLLLCTILVAFTVSCATVVPVIVKPPCPPVLVLPKIPNEDLAVLTISAYTALVQQGRMLRERIKTYRELMNCE